MSDPVKLYYDGEEPAIGDTVRRGGLPSAVEWQVVKITQLVNGASLELRSGKNAMATFLSTNSSGVRMRFADALEALLAPSDEEPA